MSNVSMREENVLDNKVSDIIQTDFFSDFFSLFAVSRYSHIQFIGWLKVTEHSQDKIKLLFKGEPAEIEKFLNNCRYLRNRELNPFTQNFIKALFYDWLLTRAQVHYQLVHSDFTHKSFIAEVENTLQKQKSLFKSILKPSQYKMEKIYLNIIRTQCADPVVFQYLKESYMRLVMSAESTKVLLNHSEGLSYQQIINTAKSLNTHFAKANQIPLTDVEEGFQFLKHKEGYKLFEQAILFNENKGFITFQHFCLQLKAYIMKHIKKQVSLHPYIKVQEFPLTGKGMTEALNYYEDLSGKKLYYYYLAGYIENVNVIDKYVGMANYVLESKINEPQKTLYNEYPLAKLQEPLEKLLNQFADHKDRRDTALFERVNNIIDSYNEGKKNDVVKGVMSGLMGGGILTLASVAFDELIIDSRIKNATKEAHDRFNTYLIQDCKKLENIMINFYDEYLKMLINKYILPYARSIFLNKHIIRKSSGIDNYIEFLNSNTKEFLDQTKEVKPIPLGKVGKSFNTRNKYIDESAYKLYTPTQSSKES